MSSVEDVLRWIRLPDIRTHRVTILRAIESKRIDFNVCDPKNGRTLAMKFIEDDESALLDALVRSATYVGAGDSKESSLQWWERTNSDGDTLLQMAVRRNSIRIVSSLLNMAQHTGLVPAQITAAMEVGADTNCDAKLVNALASFEVAGRRVNPEAPSTALHRAVKSGSAALVAAWLRAGALVEERDKYGCVPAHYVQDRTTLDVLLPTSKHWVFVKRNNRGLQYRGRTLPAYCTPIDVVVHHPLYATLLRGCLASLEGTPSMFNAIERRSDMHGQTLLHSIVAIKSSDVDVEELIPVLRVHNVANRKGDYALHASAIACDLRWFDSLWTAEQQRPGSSYDALLTDKAGRTVAHHLAANPDCGIRLLNRVLEADPALIDIQDAEGNTPLMLCFQSERAESVRGLLIPKSAGLAWSLQNDQGASLLWLMLCYAFERSIDPLGCCILSGDQAWDWTTRDPSGAPVLCALFLKYQSSDSVWFSHLLQALSEDALASVCDQGPGSRNLLHVLADKNCVSQLHDLKHLSNESASRGIHAFDSQDESPLMIAVRLGQFEFVVAFVERFTTSLDLTTRAPSGLTVVDVAHEFERSDILEYFIQKCDALHIQDLQLRRISRQKSRSTFRSLLQLGRRNGAKPGGDAGSLTKFTTRFKG